MTDASQGIPSVPHFDLADNEPLLDVREDDEWAAGHAPDARHIPLGELPARVSELDRTGRLVVTCRSGGRSSRAVAWLRGQGVDAVNLDGGMIAWHAANRPLTRTGDGAPTVL